MNPVEVAKNKHWYESRILWLGVITLVLNALALPQVGAIIPVAALPYVDALAAILIMLRRMWGTDTNLTK